MAKFGVSIDDDLVDRLEEDLEYRDSRSDRIEELTELGLLVEKIADEQGVGLPDSERDRRAFIRQLFLDHADDR